MQIVKIQHKGGVHQREKRKFGVGETCVAGGATETGSARFSWLQSSEAARPIPRAPPAAGKERWPALPGGRLCSCWWRPEWACDGVGRGGMTRWGRPVFPLSPRPPAGSWSAGAGIPGAWRGRTQSRWGWSWPCFYQGRRKGGRWLTVWIWEREKRECSKWNTNVSPTKYYTCKLLLFFLRFLSPDRSLGSFATAAFGLLSLGQLIFSNIIVLAALTVSDENKTELIWMMISLISAELLYNWLNFVIELNGIKRTDAKWTESTLNSLQLNIDTIFFF